MMITLGVLVFIIIFAPIIPSAIWATKHWFREVWEAIKS